MASSYKKFLELLKQWPVDSTKVGRDLGQHIRERIKVAYKVGEINPPDEVECNRVHASLKRLADNHYGKTYNRETNSSASGLTAEECRALLSTEFLEELQASEQGFFSKYFSFKNK